MQNLIHTELLKQHLEIEPSLQNFIGFAMFAVKSLGADTFPASRALLELTHKLREAGAATGYPLPATLALNEACLEVIWEDGQQMTIATLPQSPEVAVIEQLKEYFLRSTEIADPALLLRRNAEMMRYLEETRLNTEKEVAAMQQTLAQRQAELGASIREAETDALTGLMNRRAYDQKLAEAFNRTTRQTNESLSLVLLDLDFFKQINDEFGHQYGDSYLIKMAESMHSVIRHGVDLTFRFGGDEFALLIFADKTIACKRALQLLSLMNNKISIGIASIAKTEPCHGNLQDFVGRADKALYEAKGSGRGRIVVDTCLANGSITWAQFLPTPITAAAK